MQLDESELAAVARRCRALGDGSRLRMVVLLQERDHTVGELARALGVAVATASRHVGVLADCGLVHRERRGAYVVCRRGQFPWAALYQLVGTCAAEPAPLQSLSPGEPISLATHDPDGVWFDLMMGAAMLRRGMHDRTAWEAEMLNLLGTRVQSHLSLLRAATLRIARGESLEGLPLPAALVEDQATSFAGYVLSGGVSLPAE